MDMARVCTAASAPVFVAMSRFAIDEGIEAEVKAAFRDRLPLVGGAPGLMRLGVPPREGSPGEIRIMTCCRDAGSYREWQRSDVHHNAHWTISNGLVTAPGEATLREFERIAADTTVIH